MKQIQFKLPELQKLAHKKNQNERGEMLQKFVDRLTQDTKPPYKPPTIRQIAVKLAYLQTKNLHSFYRECEDSSHFSKYFWWATNPKKHK